MLEVTGREHITDKSRAFGENRFRAHTKGNARMTKKKCGECRLRPELEDIGLCRPCLDRLSREHEAEMMRREIAANQGTILGYDLD